MKILMVGTGGVGEAAAIIAKQRDPEGEWLDLMVLSDFNLERTQAVSKKIADARFPAEKVNARNKDEVKALIETRSSVCGYGAFLVHTSSDGPLS